MSTQIRCFQDGSGSSPIIPKCWEGEESRAQFWGLCTHKTPKKSSRKLPPPPSPSPDPPVLSFPAFQGKVVLFRWKKDKNPISPGKRINPISHRVTSHGAPPKNCQHPPQIANIHTCQHLGAALAPPGPAALLQNNNNKKIGMKEAPAPQRVEGIFWERPNSPFFPPPKTPKRGRES